MPEVSEIATPHRPEAFQMEDTLDKAPSRAERPFRFLAIAGVAITGSAAIVATVLAIVLTKQTAKVPSKNLRCMACPANLQSDPAPFTRGPRASGFFKGFDCAAYQLACKMRRDLERRPDSGHLVLVGEGNFGRIYALQGGYVMKVQRGNTVKEALLASNLPRTSTLAWSPKFDIIAGAGDIVNFTGYVMSNIHGFPGYMYPQRKISNDQLVQVAADLAIALHAMHTKIDGYVVMHCDIHRSAKNAIIVEGVEGKLWHAALIDYGASVVHHLQKNEKISDPIFQTPIYGCHATDWNDPDKRTPGQFGVSADWRVLGRAIYGMVVENLNAIWEGQNQTCGSDNKCAAEHNIDSMPIASNDLKSFIKLLFVNHDQIHDEVADVLQHPVFASFPKPLSAVVAQIKSVTVSREFLAAFADTEMVIV